MKGKHLALLLLLVALVGGASWYLQKSNVSSWSETGSGAGGKVVNLPINDVARIVIKDADKAVNLVQKNDTWTVEERGDYPAAFDKVSELLRKVWDLKTVQDVKVGGSQLSRLELVEPAKDAKNAGTLLDFQDKDGKRLQALLLGKKYLRKSTGGDMPGFPAGRYVMPIGDKAKVSLVSEALEDVVTKPEEWLNKDFFKIESPSAISVVGTTDAVKWKLTRENGVGDWKLADAKPDEQLDTAKVSSFANAFSNATFTDVLAPNVAPAETGLDKPSLITVETAEGFSYVMKVGKLSGENYPLMLEVSGNFPKERTPGKDEKPEDKTKLDDEFKAKQKRLEEKLASEKKFEGRVYLVGKFSIDALLKDRAALLAEKKPEPAPAPAAGAPTPPVPSTGGKVEAATPPVSAPPSAPPATPPPAAPTAPTPAPPAPPAPSAAPAAPPAPAAPQP
jgi:hypothetical protein